MSLATPPDSSTPSFLQYTGIPPSWLKKRPKLPSRNWLIFLSTTAAITTLYAYDRRKCKQIREHYVEKVRHLSDDPLSPLGLARKVTVYGCKYPGDEDADRSLKYFRKYVKPILVAAAVDFEMINGNRHGSLAGIVSDQAKSRRLSDLGLDPPRLTNVIHLPFNEPAERRKRELAGGIIIIGRHTFKEFLHGLKRGWSEPPYKVDKEELLARELEFDGVFDEVETGDTNAPLVEDSATADSHPRLQTIKGSPFYFPPQLKTPPKASSTRSELATVNPQLEIPPSSIPPYPPILLVPFTNLIGFTLIPRMIWDFFHQRHKVREGADAAYRLITGTPGPIRGRSSDEHQEEHQEEIETSPSSDLSFDLQVESLYKSTSLPSDIEKSRKFYYEALQTKITTARQLARGEREPTNDERNYSPPTEVELRAERMAKELRWRGDLLGWQIISPITPVAWDPRFASALFVYPDVETDNEQQAQNTHVS